MIYEAPTNRMIKAARCLLRWSQEDLARHANVSLSTVKRMEKHQRLGGNVESLTAVVGTLKDNGIVFGADGVESVLLRRADPRTNFGEMDEEVA